MHRFTWLVLALAMLSSCSPTTIPATALSSEGSLYVFRLQPPAMLELSANNKVVHEIPVAIPDGCTLEQLMAPAAGTTLAIEFSCAFGPAVVWLDTNGGQARQPITDSDSHFMAWTADGQAAYIKVDTMSRPHIVRVPLHGTIENVPITELSYDVSPKPNSSGQFLFSFSRGMGLGSEMWFSSFDGRLTKQVTTDPHSYISFARWSPDGSQVAFIKIPDSATPFTVGELWVMQADGSQEQKLADADAGHGYAEAWSPDGSRIAFVVRQNPTDAQADQNAEALQSDISMVGVRDGAEAPLTHFEGARIEAPLWSPDGSRIAFTGILDDKMNVYTADTKSGLVSQALDVSTCCPVWMRK